MRAPLVVPPMDTAHASGSTAVRTGRRALTTEGAKRPTFVKVARCVRDGLGGISGGDGMVVSRQWLASVEGLTSLLHRDILSFTSDLSTLTTMLLPGSVDSGRKACRFSAYAIDVVRYPIRAHDTCPSN